MSRVALALALAGLAAAGGCRGVLGIETPIVVAGTDGATVTDGAAPIDGVAPDDGLVAIDAPADALRVPLDGGGTAITPIAIQGASQDPASSAHVSVKLANPETAGDTNIVAIGWLGGAPSFSNVTDSQGNTYVAATPIITNDGSQVIYYGRVQTGANTVTVNFTSPISYPDVRVAEYSGIAAQAPIDGSVYSTGTSAVCNSGALITTHAIDLLVSANYDLSYTQAVGNSFSERVLSEPDKDVLADRVVTTAGSYTSTATLTSTSSWIMQLVAFKAEATPGG